MMNNNEINNILEKTRMKIAVANLKREDKFMKSGKKLKIVASFVLVFVLTSGIVFAANYNKIMNYFGLGGGIDRAVENGYIENPDQEYIGSDAELSDEELGIVLDNIKVNAKIDDFLMDDLNLSTHFNFEFDEGIKSVIDINKLGRIELKDLIVTDEENSILYCLNRKAFEEYCDKNNLSYMYGEFNEKYMNNGLNAFILSKNAYGNSVILTYNMYNDGSYGFPKSKKLNFHFNTIMLTSDGELENDEKKVFLKGDWNIELNVPEKMYNRKSIAYKVVNCSQKNFDIYRANVSDTGFEIGITIYIDNPNASRLKELIESGEKKDAGKINEEEYDKITDKIFAEWVMTRPIRLFQNEFDFDITQANREIPLNGKIEPITYVENSNGKKFECTLSPSRRQNANFVDDKRFDFYETFGLTTYDATDKIKVVLQYHGSPVTIELEKYK